MLSRVFADQVTWASIVLALVPTLVRMSDIGLADTWADKPRVGDWLARVQARPSFAQAFYPGSRYGAAGSHPGLQAPAH